MAKYSTVQYSTVQYSTVQYSTVEFSTVKYSTVQYSRVESRNVLLVFSFVARVSVLAPECSRGCQVSLCSVNLVLLLHYQQWPHWTMLKI